MYLSAIENASERLAKIIVDHPDILGKMSIKGIEPKESGLTVILSRNNNQVSVYFDEEYLEEEDTDSILINCMSSAFEEICE